MAIFKRLSSSLFAPREVINYRRDKWYISLLYFIFLLILIIVPIIIVVYKQDILSNTLQQSIKEAFIGEDIPFTIEGGKLIHKDGDEALIYRKELRNGMNIVISASDDFDYATSAKDINIVLDKEGIYLVQTLIKYRLLKYEDHVELEGLDLSKASEYNNFTFWGTIFNVMEKIIKKFQPFIRVYSVAAYVIESVFNLLFISLALAFIQSFGRSRVIKFSEVWKMCIYLMAPYAFGYTLYIIFSQILFYYIGFALSTIYVLIANRHLQSELMRRKDNEL